MTFDPSSINAFLALFDDASPRIRRFSGCLHLELWHDPRYPNIMTTYSHWNSAEDLEAYRKSAFFKSTWAKTKPLFAAPPVAHSHVLLRSLDK